MTLTNKAKSDEHNVILTKYGADIYIDETTTKSNYPDEKGRIENVAEISGNVDYYPLILTQNNIVELRDVLEVLIEKERNRIGVNPNWGKRQ